MSEFISRQDVLKLIENTPYDWSNITERTEMLRKIKALEGQRIGKWEKRKVKVMCPRDCWYPSCFAIDGTWNEEEGWNLEWQGEFCSNCGEQYDWQHNFCPNCGAKMLAKDTNVPTKKGADDVD